MLVVVANYQVLKPIAIEQLSMRIEKKRETPIIHNSVEALVGELLKENGRRFSGPIPMDGHPIHGIAAFRAEME